MGKVQRAPLVEPGVPAAAGMAGLLPTSRKYLGSKHALAGWICDRIVAAAGLPRTFLDGFAGTGAIAVELARRGAPAITCVDNLLSNTVVGSRPTSRRCRPRSRHWWHSGSSACALCPGARGT